MPSRLAILLVGSVFLVTLLIRLPASWLTALLPGQTSCAEPSGTLWHGACGRLQVADLGIADVQWTLHPASLLRFRPLVDVRSADPRVAGSAGVALERSGNAEIYDVSATLPLQGGVLPVPPGWNGELQLSIARASLVAGHVQSIEGSARVPQLSLERPSVDLGGFEVLFPAAAAGPVIASLRDLGGPVSLQGTLRLDGNAYTLDALLAARDASDSQLQQMLQLLGPADEQGRHVLSIAGTY